MDTDVKEAAGSPSHVDPDMYGSKRKDPGETVLLVQPADDSVWEVFCALLSKFLIEPYSCPLPQDTQEAMDVRVLLHRPDTTLCC